MNTFLTIFCVALVASASAQPAYNYQAPKLQSGSGFRVQAQPQQQQVFRPAQAASSPVYSAVQSQPISLPAPAPAQVSLPAAPHFAPPATQYGEPTTQYLSPAPQFVAPVQQQQQQHFAAPVQQHQQHFSAPVQQQQQHFAGPVQQQQHFVAPAPVPQYQPVNYQQPQQQTIISKDIYIHSAPDEVEEIGNEPQSNAGPLRKNYRIVFIKAPSQNVKLNLNALKRAQASNEEKTVIYVLSKKPDFGDIQSQLASVQTEQKAHKPEVYFIKYKTQEEANRAQQEIQAQYDSLGGSTHISDEGVAPVTSVIGGGSVNIGNHLGGNLGGGAVNVGNLGGGAAVHSANLSGQIVHNSAQGAVNFGQQQQQQFVQQSYHSSHASSAATADFGAVPSQKYLPAKKK